MFLDPSGHFLKVKKNCNERTVEIFEQLLLIIIFHKTLSWY